MFLRNLFQLKNSLACCFLHCDKPFLTLSVPRSYSGSCCRCRASCVFAQIGVHSAASFLHGHIPLCISAAVSCAFRQLVCMLGRK